MWTDIMNNKFDIGDYVCISYHRGRSNSGLVTGWVIRETPQRVVILENPLIGHRTESQISKSDTDNRILLLEHQRPINQLNCSICGLVGHNYIDEKQHSRLEGMGLL